ncbi:MAG: DUF5677 domain-containing protein [Defluviitaleaceae bacterium]|nr:DUF5677 domain-containing protein [Defluviitaleaceae bacterium]
MNNKYHLLKCISNDIQEHLLGGGSEISFPEGYDWLIEVMTLIDSQTKLFESTVELLEARMPEEAVLLWRAQFIRCLWISYLCNNDVTTQNKRVTEYLMQTHISSKTENKSYKKVSETELFKNTISEMGLNPVSESILDEKIEIANSTLKDENMEKARFATVCRLAETDTLLSAMYSSHYLKASRYEHAEADAISKYRTVVDSTTGKKVSFDFRKTDIDMVKDVKISSIIILSYSLDKITSFIKESHPHLFGCMLNKGKLEEIINQLSQLLPDVPNS